MYGVVGLRFILHGYVDGAAQVAFARDAEGRLVEEEDTAALVNYN